MKFYDLPMNLQMFAEQDDNSGASGQDGTQVNDEPSDNTDVNQDNGTGSESVIEKLQKRIGQEQGKKNELADELSKVKAELDKLKGGDGKPAEPTAEEKRIAELEAQLARNEVIKQTNAVFADSDLEVPEAVTDLIVTNDKEQTVSNAKTLIDWLVSEKKATEDDVRKQYSKGYVPNSNRHSSNANFGELVSKSASGLAPIDKFK